MSRVRRWLAPLSAVIVLVAAGCAPPSAPASQAPPQRPAGAEPAPAAGNTAQGTTPKRITVAMLGEPPAFWDDINPTGGTVPGMGQFEGLATAGLTVLDEKGARHAQLAEEVPSTDNGLWKVNADGTMETRWRIRDGARWHDGKPFTSEDLVFTATAGQDADLAVFRTPAYDLIESVDAPDSRTIVVQWKRPFIGADTMFSIGSEGFAPPMPKHLLGQAFETNKPTFTELPYWTSEFVSSGPFKLQEWATASHVLLAAFPEYVLGRPKIDAVEVKFIPDPSTLLANVLAGTVDLTFSRSVSIEQAGPVRDQWREGKMLPYTAGWTMMYPQLRAPVPPALGDPQLRRAIIMAIDRQQLAETLTAGLATVAHSIIAPDQAEYASIEKDIVRYDYDQRRSAQMIESLGFTRGQDGSFRDGAGQPLSVEVRTTTNDANQKATFAIADYLQRAGLTAEPFVIPVQQLQNREFRATYPGLELVNQPAGANGFRNLLHSSAAPLPERNYRAPASSRNRGQYVNPDYDALMDQYNTTIPARERMQAMGQIIRQQTDQQLLMGIFYTVDAIMMANRLKNVPPASTWNAETWEVSS